MSLTSSSALNPGTGSFSTRMSSTARKVRSGGTFGRSARLSAGVGSRKKENRKPPHNPRQEPLALSLSGLTVSSRVLGGGTRNEQEQTGPIRGHVQIPVFSGQGQAVIQIPIPSMNE